MHNRDISYTFGMRRFRFSSPTVLFIFFLNFVPISNMPLRSIIILTQLQVRVILATLLFSLEFV
jgi:hypothetical protein